MRNALKKPANNAAWITNQFNRNQKAGMTYEDEGCVHLFEPFFLAFAINDLHFCHLRIRTCVVTCVHTCLRYSIPRQS